MTNEYNVFVSEVKVRAFLPNESLATISIRATLETLAEWLEPTSHAIILPYLPPELHDCFKHPAGDSGSFSLKTFFNRICLRENGSLLSAVFQARCVLQVLAEFIPEEKMEVLKNLLPKELRALVDSNMNEAAHPLAR